MQYQETIQYLFDLRLFGSKLGLDQVRRLAEQVGSPHDRLSFVHVAGTNGKGSVCAMLESIYRSSGMKVGLFTSPHLVSFRERMQVNRQPISMEDLVRLVEGMKIRLASWPQEWHPTFFEVVTVLALQFFAEQDCDVVIWETGMGGRLDATNIVQPRVTVITNVGLDHQKWLGTTLREVAREKAGIIKPGIPVITAADGEAWEVVESTARACSAPVRRIKPGLSASSWLESVKLGLPGQHQRENAAVAVAAVEVMQDLWPVPEPVIREGLEKAHWPGRMQQVILGSGMKVLLDGAHNLAGFSMLKRELEEVYAGQGKALVMGVLDDKDWAGLCRLLAPLANKVCLVPVQAMNSVLPETLAAACRDAAPRAEVRACADLAEAFEILKDEPMVVVTGSIYLVGQAMAALQLSPLPPANESALNEASFKSDPTRN
jgi:dihydrofolate synthase/folylpolyglutamate synthase